MGKDVKRKLNISEVEHELFIIGCRAMRQVYCRKIWEVLALKLFTTVGDELELLRNCILN